MPKCQDIKRVLIIGSGPIVISQACEFDYSGTQACKALKSEGYEVVLINSNPATIMTDPEMANRTYIEPIIPEAVAKVIEKERPDAILPTLGGQTGLNVAVTVAEMGILDRYHVEMIGASLNVIKKAEDRELFRESMERIGLRVPKSGIARNLDEARKITQEIDFPLIIRPSFTLGGTGGGVAYNREDLESLVEAGLEASLIHEIMMEESVIGWKEYELEVMRDKMDNVVIICSIENFDPMGIHTGDSITIAPAQTLSDKEYQNMRNAAIAIIREIGVETGGSNIQFAVNPDNGEMVVIEMNPRVSRSSALASKATGFPIAKIAAKLAVGYSLDEIPNDITKETLASFEPTIDYCVVKIPRWTFEKFMGSEDVLTTSMKSVGETMAIGRTFKEALQKGLRSLEIGRYGLGADGRDAREKGVGPTKEEIRKKLFFPNSHRIFYIRLAFKYGFTVDEIYKMTHIDRWFLENIRQIVTLEDELSSYKGKPITSIPQAPFEKAKEYGFSDRQLAFLLNSHEDTIRQERESRSIIPVYKLVDTCAAEFEAYTPYYYSTYEVEDEIRVSNKPKIMILGGGPNRIGQGIEFDYCCVHASFALKEEGYESIMVNSNPETVSTDYDTSDKLYFEPLTKEDILNIVAKEKPDGVIVQFGGQTPLDLAVPLAKAGVPIIGTSPDSIDRSEDRERFKRLLKKLELVQPANGTATTIDEALRIAEKIGFPVVVRPSYVLGGRAMEIVYDEEDLKSFTKAAVSVSPKHPILVDKFLEDAIEVDVDAVSDGEITIVAGIMEHIEEAGVHSGDSACVLPPITLGTKVIEKIVADTRALAKELKVVGLMNVQYAVKDGVVYVLEVNPRASRTVPFVSKATGIPWAKIATKLMLGRMLPDLGLTEEIVPHHISVKESVFPFVRFPGVDTLLGPEMKSTGEVMGIDFSFGMAFTKSQFGAGQMLPLKGKVFVSVRDSDKKAIVPIAKCFHKMGFEILATTGTSRVLSEKGIPNKRILKVREGRPNTVDYIKNEEIALVINTAEGRETTHDARILRRSTLEHNIPYTTTVAGAKAVATGIKELLKGGLNVKPLQEYHGS